MFESQPSRRRVHNAGSNQQNNTSTRYHDHVGDFTPDRAGDCFKIAVEVMPWPSWRNPTRNGYRYVLDRPTSKRSPAHAILLVGRNVLARFEPNGEVES